jgi:hypothetical protein
MNSKSTPVELTTMNRGYLNVRFLTSLPDGILPESFGVVTAWNPDGLTAAPGINDAASARLQAQLLSDGHAYFPVPGGSPDFAHAETGFGILATRDRCLELGRQYRQEAIFWIEHGNVHLCSCTDDSQITLGSWQDLTCNPARISSLILH